MLCVNAWADIGGDRDGARIDLPGTLFDMRIISEHIDRELGSGAVRIRENFRLFRLDITLPLIPEFIRTRFTVGRPHSACALYVVRPFGTNCDNIEETLFYRLLLQFIQLNAGFVLCVGSTCRI